MPLRTNVAWVRNANVSIVGNVKPTPWGHSDSGSTAALQAASRGSTPRVSTDV